MKRIATLCALALALAAAPAAADEHRSDRAGHPLRILAAIVHPIGVAIDYVILRPAHWLAHREPVKTLTGHEEDGLTDHEEGTLTGRDEDPLAGHEDETLTEPEED